MNERLKRQERAETQTLEIYKRVDFLTQEYGENYGDLGKKAAVVLTGGIDSLTSCASVSLYSGHKEDEVKIIYESEKNSGVIERVELAFRKNGDFDKRVLRSNPSNNIYSLEEAYRTKTTTLIELEGVNALLSFAESNIRDTYQEKPCPDFFSRPKHKHPISLKRRVQPQEQHSNI